jgi:hypothetical protein
MTYAELRTICRDIVTEIEMFATMDKSETQVRNKLQESIAANVKRIADAQKR